MIPNRDEDRRNRKRRWMRHIEMSWGEILTVCEEEFGEDNLVMVEKVERNIKSVVYEDRKLDTWLANGE